MWVDNLELVECMRCRAADRAETSYDPLNLLCNNIINQYTNLPRITQYRTHRPTWTAWHMRRLGDAPGWLGDSLAVLVRPSRGMDRG